MEKLVKQRSNGDYFAKEFEKIRPELRVYVTSILGSNDGVDDVLQEAALFALQKSETISEIRNFKSWCLRVAYFKALAYQRDRSRLGELNLRTEILEQVVSRAEEGVFKMSARREALKHCLQKMRPADIELMNLKYIDGENLTKMSKVWGKSANQLHKMISRVRAKLRICIEKQLS